MKKLLAFLLGVVLAAASAVVAAYRSGGDLQFKMRLAQDVAARQPIDAAPSDAGDARLSVTVRLRYLNLIACA